MTFDEACEALGGGDAVIRAGLDDALWIDRDTGMLVMDLGVPYRFTLDDVRAIDWRVEP